MSDSKRRDDIFNRLSFLLRTEYSLQLERVTPLKSQVWIVETNEGKKVLKGYSSLRQATIQIIFMSALKEAGFAELPSLKTNTLRSGIICFRDAYWILQDYITPARPFTYASCQDRKDGLSLLERYHMYAERLLHHPFLHASIPRYDLYKKWRRRYQHFLYYLPLIQQRISTDKLQFIVQSAEDSLKSLESCYSLLEVEENTVVHGDVASHNFLRSGDDKLYLIDYDLLAIAPPSIDYLQYANRILPHINWSFAQLQQLPCISKQLEKKWFLSALMFPADLMREWNFHLTKRPFDQSFFKWTVHFTNSQFKNRKQFVEKIRDMIR